MEIELEKLAREMVGDGKDPNWFFVSDSKGIALVTRDFNAAYAFWLSLPRNADSSLEDRKTGTLCQIFPAHAENDGEFDEYDCAEQYGYLVS